MQKGSGSPRRTALPPPITLGMAGSKAAEQPLSPWLQPLRTPRPHRIISRVILVLVSLYALYLYVTLPIGARGSVRVERQVQGLDPRRTEGWAQYRPYTPVETYRAPPQECNIVQVHILQRHGARYPTSGAGERIIEVLDKLYAAENLTGPLAFIRDYKYDLGEDELVPLGAVESYNAGSLIYERYAHLFEDGDPDIVPFVRASSGKRVVESATNWTAGFAWASRQDVPPLAVILSEAGNDTLDDKNCPLADANPSPLPSLYVNTSLIPLTAQLASYSSPRANLTPDDTYALLSLCPFESVTHDSLSEWCTLFDALHADWRMYSYAADIEKYFGTGHGAPLGRVQGVGFALELLARLTHTPLNLASPLGVLNVNRTLDAREETFPLGRRVYADFSHDNAMVAVYAALGLFKPEYPLNASTVQEGPWRVERMVPFAGRAVVEKLVCVGGAADEASGEYVRVLVNDAVQSLEGCAPRAGAWTGVCGLREWIESLGYVRARGEGDWARCFEDEGSMQERR